MWTEPSRRGDGMPEFACPAAQRRADPGAVNAAVRCFDAGRGRPAPESRLAAASPAFVILSTAADDTPAWLRAGQALERVLLVAEQSGHAVSHLNQVVEVRSLRPHVAALAGAARYPQLVLRMGLGATVRRSPRRPVVDVMA
jgi:hypothetical protein